MTLTISLCLQISLYFLIIYVSCNFLVHVVWSFRQPLLQLGNFGHYPQHTFINIIMIFFLLLVPHVFLIENFSPMFQVVVCIEIWDEISRIHLPNSWISCFSNSAMNITFQNTPSENFFMAIDREGNLAEVGWFLYPSMNFIKWQSQWWVVRKQMFEFIHVKSPSFGWRLPLFDLLKRETRQVCC